MENVRTSDELMDQLSNMDREQFWGELWSRGSKFTLNLWEEILRL